MSRKFWGVASLAAASIIPFQLTAAAEAVRAAATDPLEEIVITGTNIRGAEPIGSSVIAVDRETITNASGVTMSSILLETPQVMNFGITESSRGGNGGAGNITFGSSINIRGISPFGTLTLLNGHRMPPNGTTGAAPDPNVIPTIAVERVEILANGASAIYGSDAISGVANIIMRRNFEGFEANMQYGEADGYNERMLNAIVGKSWEGGNITLSAEQGFHTALHGPDRDFYRSDQRDSGGSDYRVTLCAPGNVVVSGTSYAIPASGATPTNLVAGTANRCDNIRNLDLIPEQDHKTVALTIDHEINDTFSVFGEAYGARREYYRTLPAPTATLTVPATNPYYVAPAGVTPPVCGAAVGAPAGTRCVTVQYSYANDYGATNELFDSSGFARTMHTLAGINVNLPNDWRLVGTVSYGKDTEQNSGTTNLNNAGVLVPALRATTREAAFNPFGTSKNNPAILSLLADQISLAPGRSIQRNFTANLDGKLFSMPGGDARAAFGVGELYSNLVGGQTQGARIAPVTRTVTNERTIRSIFAEFSFPLVSDINARPGLRGLELSVAGRQERYSDFGNTTHPMVGLDYKPIDSLTTHFSYGTSFRAPGMSQLKAIATPGIFVQNYSDPLANNGAGGTTQGAAINGGNPNLTPEEATTYSFGFDWTPESMPGLSVGVNYFDIEYTDQVISYLSNLLILQNPVAYGSIFQRRPADAAGSAAFTTMLQEQINSGRTLNNGTAASIAALNLFVDGRSSNQAVTKADGFDFNVRYLFSVDGWGDFNLGLAGTRFTNYVTAATSTAPEFDVLNLITYPFRMRTRVSLGWRKDESLSAGLYMNYTGSYTNNLATPVQSVSDYTTFDMRASYTVGTLTFGFDVTNLTDEEPPYVNLLPGNNGGGAFDPNGGNPIGRLMSLSIGNKF